MQSVEGRGKRDFNFDLPSISDIKTLTVDIKKPARTEGFKAIPAAAQVKSDGQFEDHLYSFAGVTPGQRFAFNVTYSRADSNPSVDSKTGQVSTGGSQQTTLLLIFIAVFIAALVGIGVWRTKTTATKAKARPVKKGSGKSNASTKKKGTKGKKTGKSQGKSTDGAGSFCSNCGTAISPDAKFCAECGTSR